MQSVLQALAKEYPEIEKAIAEESIWDYSVYGPMSLDDSLEVTVYIHFGKTKRESSKTYRLKLEVQSIKVKHDLKPEIPPEKGRVDGDLIPPR